MTNIQLIKNNLGEVRLILRGGWTAEFEQELKETEYDFDRLVLGNYDWKNFEFLPRFFPKLQKLQIQASISDFSGIEKLTCLKFLMLTALNEAKLDFSNLMNLEELEIHYYNKKTLSTLFELKQLKILILRKYSEKDCSQFENLTSLAYLELVGGSLKSLKGLEILPNLEEIVLYYLRNLTDISQLDQLEKLEKFMIAKCSKLTPEVIIEQLPNVITKRYKSIENSKKEDLLAIPKENGGLWEPKLL